MMGKGVGLVVGGEMEEKEGGEEERRGVEKTKDVEREREREK